jgi:hypothetical protein
VGRIGTVAEMIGEIAARTNLLTLFAETLQHFRYLGKGEARSTLVIPMISLRQPGRMGTLGDAVTSIGGHPPSGTKSIGREMGGRRCGRVRDARGQLGTPDSA